MILRANRPPQSSGNKEGNMDYGEILSKSWKIVWKFKVLWIFGFFAGCGTSRGGNFNFNNSFGTGNGASGPSPSLPPEIQLALHRLELLFNDPAFIWKFIAAVIGLICVAVLVQVFFVAIGRIGLIKGATEADAGAEKLTFGELWKGSLPYFWRIFWLSVLIGLPFFVVALAIAAGFVFSLVPLAGNRPDVSAFLLFISVLCGLLCVILLLAILIGLVSRQAERAIVIENLSILDGLRRGWNVFTSNIGPILIIWLIQAAIGFIASIVIALPLLIILVPVMIVFLSNVNGADSSFVPWLIAVLCIILAYVPVAWIANGILMA